MTIQSQSSRQLQLRVKRPLPNLLVRGFQLCLRNWPCVVWAYAVNLIFSLLAAIPVATGLASYLDHTLAAQRIAGTLNIASLEELGLHLRDTSFTPMVLHTASWLNLLQMLVLFIFFAGSVFVFVAAEPPRLSGLLRGGVAYFWRFVRAAILAGCVAAIILGVLLGVRAALLARADAAYVERQMFYFSLISGAVVLLVALLVRLWWDLVEIYIVRNAMDGERRVHQALLPALRLLFGYFFRTFGSFLLVGLAGVAAFALCLYFWKALPAHQVWIAALLAQLGLFLLLASRFWQRGIEAALVMSIDPPIVTREELAGEEMAAEDLIVLEDGMPVPPGVGVLTGLSEPTLRDLVAKLRTEPWANPEVTSPRPVPELDPAFLSSPPAKPAEANEPFSSSMDRHDTKFPLGGLGPERPADPAANLIEETKITEDPAKDDGAKLPHSEKKPLP
jgi:hypothetical protein